MYFSVGINWMLNVTIKMKIKIKLFWLAKAVHILSREYDIRQTLKGG